MRSPRTLVGGVLWVLTAVTAFAALTNSEVTLVRQAATLVNNIQSVPARDTPNWVWNDAKCIVVVPTLNDEALATLGREVGEGVMSCRHANAWGPPIFIQLDKGSEGFGFGVHDIEVVLVLLNRSSVDKLLQGQATLGVDISVASGPVRGLAFGGATDDEISPEIVSYRRVRGRLLGLDLSGAAVTPDRQANADAYGPNISTRDIVLGTVAVPATPEWQALITALNQAITGTSSGTNN